MKEKTLAIIMAAGYGIRLGGVVKPLEVKDEEGRPAIESAFTFLKSKSASLDFAVLSREGESHKDLKDYLEGHSQRDKFSVLYQKTEPKSYVVAFVWEYFLNAHFRNYLKNYTNILLLPGDHLLTDKELDITDLIAKHQQKNAQVTIVYSPGWRDDTSKKDAVKIGYKNKIRYLKRIHDTEGYNLKEREHKLTSVGLWLIKRRTLYNPLKLIPPLISFGIAERGYSLLIKAYAYSIGEWAGARDTPKSIGK